MMTIACHGVQNSLQMPNISYFIDFRDTFHVCLELELEVYNCLVVIGSTPPCLRLMIFREMNSLYSIENVKRIN